MFTPHWEPLHAETQSVSFFISNVLQAGNLQTYILRYGWHASYSCAHFVCIFLIYVNKLHFNQILQKIEASDGLLNTNKYLTGDMKRDMWHA